VSSTVLTPVSAGDVSGWSNEANVLDQDNVVATLAAGAGASTWLPIQLQTATIPEDDELVGYVLDIWAGLSTTPVLPSIGEESQTRLQIALSTDGATPLGSAKSVDVYRQVGQITAGGVGDPWDTSLTPAQVNAGLYLLVRRPSVVDEDTIAVRLVDYARLTAYHNPSGGSLMAERMTSLQRSQIGKESTRGTAVAATQRLMSAKIIPNLEQVLEGHTPQGEKLESEQLLKAEWASGRIEGIPCYRELGVLLASALAKPVSSGAGAGAKNVHEFRFVNRAPADFQTYTYEYGQDGARAEEYAYMNVTDLELGFKRSGGEGSMSGTCLMRRIEDDITLTAGTNPQQTITLTGGTTGVWRARYKGAETADLAYNITTGALQTALQALSTGAGITVGGSAGAWVATIPSGENEPLIEITKNTTGGTFTVETTTLGGLLEFERMPILPGHLSVYVADTYAGLAAGKLSNCFASGWAAKNMRAPVWLHDDEITSFAEHSDSNGVIESPLTVKANSNGMAYLTSIRANALKYVRLKWTGPIITGSDRFGLEIDLAAKFTQLPPINDVDGMVARQWMLRAGLDPAEAFSCVVRLTNDVASY